MKLRQYLRIASLSALLACGKEGPKTIEGYEVTQYHSGNDVCTQIHRPDGYTCWESQGKEMGLSGEVYPSELERFTNNKREHGIIIESEREERLSAMSDADKVTMKLDCYRILGKYNVEKK